jgi:phage-related protein
MSIISFLTSVASRVFLWFGDQFDQAIQVINNVWTWISDAVSDALITAYNTAWYLVNDLRDYVTAWLDDLWTAVDNASQFAATLINAVYTYIDGQITDLYEWITTNFNNLGIDLGAVYDYIASQVDQFTSGLRDALTNLIYSITDPISAAINSLLDNQGLLSGLDLAKLSDLLSRMYDTLVEFISNPAGFILGVIKDDLFDWIAGILADWTE